MNRKLLQLGTIVKNGYAGDRNPGKVFMVMGISGPYVKVISKDINGELCWDRYRKSDIEDPEGKFENIGFLPIGEIILTAFKKAEE